MSAMRKYADVPIYIAPRTADDDDPLEEEDPFESESEIASVADESCDKLDHSETGNSPKSPSKRPLDEPEGGAPSKRLRRLPKPTITSTALALFAEFQIRHYKCELDEALQARSVRLATWAAYEKSFKCEMNLKFTDHVETMKSWAFLMMMSPPKEWNDNFVHAMHANELFSSDCKHQWAMYSRGAERLSETIPTKKTLIEAYEAKACLTTTKWRREVESNDEDVTCIELLKKLLHEATSL